MLESNKKRLFSELRFELDKDRAKTTIYPLTQLSLMQITRQRMNQNISERISELCTTCEGLGRVRSKGITIREIEDWLRKFKLKSNEFRLLLFVSPEVAAYLSEGTFSRLSKIMLRYFVKIKVLQNDKLSNDKFQFYSVKRQKEITKDF
jgi:ribonuclease G